jgi:rRNA maturation endonuclease Nob1
MDKKLLLGLPCSQCKRYFPASDLLCPLCGGERLKLVTEGK